MMERAALSAEQIDCLQKVPVGRLATADAMGRPHLIPVCFAYYEGRIYSALDAKPKRGSRYGLRRVRNIRENPQVALLLDHYEEDWTRLWYLLVFGVAEVVEEGAESAEAIGALREKYAQYRRMALEGSPVIRIEPERAAGWWGGGVVL